MLDHGQGLGRNRVFKLGDVYKGCPEEIDAL